MCPAGGILGGVLLVMLFLTHSSPFVEARCDTTPDSNGLVIILADQTSIGSDAFNRCATLKAVSLAADSLRM